MPTLEEIRMKLSGTGKSGASKIDDYDEAEERLGNDKMTFYLGETEDIMLNFGRYAGSLVSNIAVQDHEGRAYLEYLITMNVSARTREIIRFHLDKVK